MKKNIIFLITIIFSFLLNSCEKVKNDWVNGKGLIQLIGEYKTFDNNFLIINEEGNKISYSLKNKNKTILKSDYDFSSYHRWYLIYDENGLWFYSGDIGSVYWKKSLDNTFEQILLNKEQISKYFKRMPEVLKSDLESWISGE